jgi:hypothetical protein
MTVYELTGEFLFWPNSTYQLTIAKVCCQP